MRYRFCSNCTIFADSTRDEPGTGTPLAKVEGYSTEEEEEDENEDENLGKVVEIIMDSRTPEKDLE